MAEYPMFTHEKLIAYQRAIAFVAWTQPVMESLPTKIAARDQLDRASTSIPLNLAEGNGKFSMRDRARFWQIAHGSAVECAAVLDVIVARGLQRPEEIMEGKRLLSEIVALTLGLLNKLEARINDRVGEDEAEYIPAQNSVESPFVLKSPSPSPSPSQSELESQSQSCSQSQSMD